jgi:hypothetical protein
MKSYIYKACVVSLFCLSLTSCKKEFLNVIPQGQQVAVATKDYDLLLNDQGLSHYSYAGGWQGPMIMGDDVAAESSHFNSAQPVTQAAFKWEDQITKFGDIDWSSRVWLEQIYILNKVINEVMNSIGGTEQQKKAILAEARANRAFIYFQLINFYGKPYVAATAGTDPGFPIILTADITVKDFNRSNVQAVYDFIISDFNAAIADLPLNNSNGLRFNKSAAEGLLGKVFLFMSKNTEALALFNSAFTDNAARPVPARLYDYNQEFAAGGKFDPINYDGPSNSPGMNYLDFTESVVSKSYYNSTYSGNGYGNDPFVLTPAAQALFKASDLRLKFYAAEFPYSEPNPSGRLRKYGVMYSRFGLQLSELYLLRAEVKARLNDLQGAKVDVEELRKNRMPLADAGVPSASTSSTADLVKYIFDERIREFAMEGYRWFDMRRESVDPIFNGKTYRHTIFNFEENTSTVLTLRPVRLTMKLPYTIASTNPNLPDNP